MDISLEYDKVFLEIYKEENYLESAIQLKLFVKILNLSTIHYQFNKMAFHFCPHFTYLRSKAQPKNRLEGITV